MGIARALLAAAVRFAVVPFPAVVLAASGPARAAGAPALPDPITVHVFHDDVLHFTPDDPGRWSRPQVTPSESGRGVSRTVTLAPPPSPFRIVARVATRPIPADAQSVHDKWDRAGNVRLIVPGGADVEIVKFVTAYGGATTHEVEVTHLAALLTGSVTFAGFVDTWTSPGWRMDFALEFLPQSPEPAPDWMAEWTEGEEPAPPDWVHGVLYEPEVTAALMAAGDREAEVNIPAGTRRVMLHVLSSGHCTDGRGADEFETKEHVVLVDGVEVRRFAPWRTDCARFRDRNPHCRRWFDGSWSSDFDRSGWCPGDVVEPIVVDLTAALRPGDHRMAFRVEGVRPKDDAGHGYWRVSASLLGWTD
ncbi:MAG: peptide-N-glycosidase F-related protein [Candidatus Eiseniibacteriota bacterium]